MTRNLTIIWRAVLLVAAALVNHGGSHAQDSILFWSSQATPPNEAQALRDQVLLGFPGEVEFAPNDPDSYMPRIKAEMAAGSGRIGVIGGLHGDFASVPDGLIDLTDVLDQAGQVAYADLGALGTTEQKYVPWMQATYIMAANKKALEYLPIGADPNALSYFQLIEWAQILARETGAPKFGLPAGPTGLIHRFVQGHLYPSFTDSMVTRFASEKAEGMWATMRELWAVTAPSSLGYDFMADALLADEVWIAWDHVARLQDAFNERPDDFVAFPSPSGPAGLGFMLVVAGLGIPVSAADPEYAKRFVSFMLQPDTQLKTLGAINFFPVIEVIIPDDMPDAVKLTGRAVRAQTFSPEANPGLLPVGLGDLQTDFNEVYLDAFQRIVVREEDIRTVLNEQSAALREVMAKANAPCWAPDEPSEGVCPVE
jgi:multiple sugar transport system substrate-binding protein